MPKPFICLTFDVEEFDMPLEYGQQIDLQQQMQIGFEGLQILTPILQNQDIECTLFTTANFAQHYPSHIFNLAKKHEIASHTFYHSSFEVDDLKKSKDVLENIAQKPVLGLRMPRMREVNLQDVINAGYQYDSSINPTYVPGKYNRTHLPKIVYREDGLTRIPTSVTPTLRIPLFWLAFKNFPFWFVKHQVNLCLKNYGYAHLYFHPWEFTSQISNTKIPFYAKTGCKGNLYQKLQQLIHSYKNEVQFVSLQTFLDSTNP